MRKLQMQNRTQCIQRFKHGKFDIILQVFAVELKQYFSGGPKFLKDIPPQVKKNHAYILFFFLARIHKFT